MEKRYEIQLKLHQEKTGCYDFPVEAEPIDNLDPEKAWLFIHPCIETVSERNLKTVRSLSWKTRARIISHRAGMRIATCRNKNRAADLWNELKEFQINWTPDEDNQLDLTDRPDWQEIQSTVKKYTDEYLNG